MPLWDVINLCRLSTYMITQYTDREFAFVFLLNGEILKVKFVHHHPSRTASALSSSLFKRLPSRLRHFGLHFSIIFGILFVFHPCYTF